MAWAAVQQLGRVMHILGDPCQVLDGLWVREAGQLAGTEVAGPIRAVADEVADAERW